MPVTPAPAAVADTATSIKAKSEKAIAPTSGAVGILFSPSQLVPPSKAKKHVFSIAGQVDDMAAPLPKAGEARPKVFNNQSYTLKAGLNIVSVDECKALEESFPLVFPSPAFALIKNLGEIAGAGKRNKTLPNLLGIEQTGLAARVAFLENSKPLLQKWLTDESRPAVVQAITQRIAALDKVSPDASISFI